MVGVFWAIAILAALLLNRSSALDVGLVLLGFLALYCIARPTHRWDVFGSACLPGVTANLLHDIAGAPRWVGVLLVPVALLVAAGVDSDGACD
jgi:hypothetical protein